MRPRQLGKDTGLRLRGRNTSARLGQTRLSCYRCRRQPPCNRAGAPGGIDTRTELRLYVADMRDLSHVPETGFDAVICMDKPLPHLFCEEDLAQAAAERPVVQGPAFFSDAGRRRIVFQLWDLIDERRYQFRLYITRDTPAGWQTHHGVSTYRAVLRDELAGILERAGFIRVRWLLPSESGFYQPLVLGVAGDKDGR
jgi:hypothetical protein